MVASTRGVLYLFDCRQRFAEADSERPGEPAQRVEHVLPVGDLGLLLVQQRAGVTSAAAQPQHVAAPAAGNRSFEDTGAVRSLADLPRDRGCEARLGRLAHHAQGVLHALLRHQSDERRLLELYRETLAKRLVEDRVAGGVGEIGEDDGVLHGQPRSARERGVAGDDERHDHRAGRCQDLPPRAAAAGRRARGRDRGPTLLEALQVCQYFRRVLIPQAAIPLEASVGDARQIGRERAV